MCGGEGRRLRPLSRQRFPKPFIKPFQSKSLFQKTLSRVEALGNPIALTRYDLQGLVTQQAGYEIDCVIEPMAKNTGPAILKACLEANDRDAPYLFLPTDHDIQNIAPLLKALELIDVQDKITLFGISPLFPSSQYGYIGLNPTAFYEKPDRHLAREYIRNGFLWNSGMVLATPKTILREASLYASDMLKLVEENCYSEIKSNSFDYAILEKSETIDSVPVDLVWRDVGTLQTYFNYFWKPYDRNQDTSKYKSHSNDRTKGVLSKS